MKQNRHERIIEIIHAHDIETQDELLEKLKEDGFEVTQATISRDIKQMHLIKFRRDGKNVWYSLADDHVKTILEMGLEHVLE